MKKFVIGLIVGVFVATGATAFAADSVKQFILTAVSYPVVVNGAEYKDDENPILNYNGSTYIPLAKIGDLTGVDYSWNDSLKQVEIVTDGGKPAASPSTSGGTKATPGGNIQLLPETQVVQPKGLAEENGETVLYAYDRDGIFKGRFVDEDDANNALAGSDGVDTLPHISQGWLGANLLSQIYDGAFPDFDGNSYVFKSPPPIYVDPGTSFTQNTYFSFDFPEDWKSKAEFTTKDGVHVKKISQDEGLAGDWVNDEQLRKITKLGLTYCDSPGSHSFDGICILDTSVTGGTKFAAKLPDGWNSSPDMSETTINGVRFKKVTGVNYVNKTDLIKLQLYNPDDYKQYLFYFNITDLEKAGILQ